ncbi:hypothetical protein PtB15_15B11 [Puccinia triticina]|nr:hypothetical protein PtB15_15B11 [Puccinia triticina]
MSSLSPIFSPRYIWLGMSIVLLTFPPFRVATAVRPVDLELRLAVKPTSHPRSAPVVVAPDGRFPSPTAAHQGQSSMEARLEQDKDLLSLRLGPRKNTVASSHQPPPNRPYDARLFSQHPGFGPGPSTVPEVTARATAAQYAPVNRGKEAMDPPLDPRKDVFELSLGPSKIPVSSHETQTKPPVGFKTGPSVETVKFALNNVRRPGLNPAPYHFQHMPPQLMNGIHLQPGPQSQQARHGTLVNSHQIIHGGPRSAAVNHRIQPAAPNPFYRQGPPTGNPHAVDVQQPSQLQRIARSVSRLQECRKRRAQVEKANNTILPRKRTKTKALIIPNPPAPELQRPLPDAKSSS